jgi:3-hydroxyisobutyrate dehydrogenase-like beta-hydroxyacid dehydrogenase
MFPLPLTQPNQDKYIVTNAVAIIGVTMRAAVLGLGEAGTIYARELAAAGFDVRGFDVRSISKPLDGVTVTTEVSEAVRGADLVVSVTTAAGALDAASSAHPHLGADAVYADLNASSPTRKAEVAKVLEGTLFADVAVLAPVARGGLNTPALVAGSGAQRFADILAPFATSIEVIDGPAGAAAGRKLLRSIFMKALATTVLESLAAGRAAGSEDWVRNQIVAELDSGGARLVERLVTGTAAHAERRLHEMEDTREYIHELGTPDEMTSATISWLSAIRDGNR